jgi:hypothetical protein
MRKPKRKNLNDQMFSARYHAVLWLPTYNCLSPWNGLGINWNIPSNKGVLIDITISVLGSENFNFASAVFISYYNYAVNMRALLLITFNTQLKLIEGSEI